jgi:hypothetical protein
MHSKSVFLDMCDAFLAFVLISAGFCNVHMCAVMLCVMMLMITLCCCLLQQVRDEADELAPGWGKQIWQQAVNRHLQARQQQQQAVQAEEDKKTQANRYISSGS